MTDTNDRTEHQPTDADDRFGDCVACGEPWPCTTDQLGDTRAELLQANARADAAEADDRDRHHTTLTTLLDTIGDPYYLMADAAEVSLHHTRVADRLRRIADAAAAATQHHTPTPAPPRLGPDPLRDHLVGVCDPARCGHCAKLRRTRIAKLTAVAHAAWHLMDDSGELSADDMADFDGDYVHLKLDHDRLSAALDELEADKWDAHPDDVDLGPRGAAMARAFGAATQQDTPT